MPSIPSDPRPNQSAPLLSQDAQPGSAVGFQQQGTVDWISMANGTVGFSVDVLSRLSKAGVEALTIYAARAIFTNIRLGEVGERRLNDALEAAKAFPSVSNILWFGFGVKHIIRSMQESSEGLACLGICASLTEQYSTVIAAKVLRELFLLYSPPADLTPTLRQWISLVEASEGLLGPTDFGLVLHGLSRFCLRDGCCNVRGCASPEHIAVALKGIFDLSKGYLDSLFLSGGADCAWMAAISHWLLDLSVEVQDRNGSVIYRPHGTKRQLRNDAQLVITYLDEPAQSIEIVRKHYIIPSGRSIFSNATDHEDDVISYGRVDWATCLSDTFGTPMKRLLSTQSRTTGICLGSASRILYAVMRDEDDTLTLEQKREVRMDAPPISSSSYGRGFFLFSRRLLPELDENTSLVGSMETALGKSYTEAVQLFSQSTVSLSSFCTCHMCSEECNPTTNIEDQPFCLITMIETICTLVRIMSVCHMQQGLEINPTRSGLEKLYWMRRQLASAPVKSGYDPIFTGLLQSWPRPSIMTLVEILFTGRGDRHMAWSKRINSPAAACCNGLCFYLNTLTEVTSDPERACLVNVIPGRIEWNKSTYDYVQDIIDEQEKGTEEYVYQSTGAEIITQYDGLMDSSSPDLKAELIVEEAATVNRGLLANYRITTQKFPSRQFLLGPRMVWYRLNDAFTAATCQGRICKSLDGFRSILVWGEGIIRKEGVLQEPLAPIIRVLPSQDLSIWLALSQTNFPAASRTNFPVASGAPRQRPSRIFNKLQGGQCIRCCVLRAAEFSEEFDTCCICIITVP
ncbi:hypothetical protein F25303_14519 [Fusarium sp. NRRL 25303]|nr:hypothetical protein F25303_14519 [Fusarium sp. NRRL 25303]